MGFEPTTFPVLPGRAQQALDEAAIFLALDVLLAADSLAPRSKRFVVDKLPGAAATQCKRIICVVVRDPLL